MAIGDGLYMLFGIDTGLPSVLDKFTYWQDVVMSAFFGESDDLLHDFPVKLYETIEGVLLNRGGLFDEETQRPNFYCKRAGTSSNPLTWSVQVYTAPTADPNKLESFEASIEEALTRTGYDVNARILRRPLRIEIDKPNPPTVKLADYWQSIASLPQNELWSVPGVAAAKDGLVLFARQMTGEKHSAFVSGKSGSGKTQLAMSLILSMAYTNSPDQLAMVLIDPKVVDMMVLSDLPHLARPVVTDDRDCQSVLDALVAEMDERKRRLENGDRSFLDKRIFVYLDEFSDFLDVVEDKEAAITAWKRLTQKGRAYGFICVGGTQRAYAIDKRVYGNLNDKYALTANDGSDAYAATGIRGVQVHKLPGRGACELWPDGTRIQGFFVADAEKPDYEKRMGLFLADINRRWQNATPCWTIGGLTDEESPTWEGFIARLRGAGELTQNQVRNDHKAYFGSGIGYPRAREIMDEVQRN